MLIDWREQARIDLRQLILFLVRRNPDAAHRIGDTIENRISLLANSPWLGRAGRIAGTRELVIAGTPYIVAYTVDPKTQIVIVLRVLHGAQRWPEEL